MYHIRKHISQKLQMISGLASLLALVPSCATDPGQGTPPPAVDGSGRRAVGDSFNGRNDLWAEAMDRVASIDRRRPLPGAQLDVSPRELDFGSTATELDFEVWNRGRGTAAYTLTSSAGWLTLSSDGGESVGEHDVITATVSRAGLPAGEQRAEITVTSGTGDSIVVSVVMVVPAPIDTDPMTTATRTEGVAPLAVLFDATDAASGVVQPADGRHEAFAYHWDFGDPESGVWDTNGRSRNHACGYVAGHVYEVPGTYTITLTVEEPGADPRVYEQTIVVSDPEDAGWTTYYVSSSTGSDANDGRSEARPFQSISRAMGVLGPSTRVLLRRGDSFNAGGGIGLSMSGPAILGAYGSGARPVIRFAGSGFQVRGGGTHQDLRFVDLEMIGPGGGGIFLMAEGVPMHRPLFLRVAADNWGRGIVLSAGANDFPEVAVVDSDFTRISSAWCVYLGVTRAMILGNTMSNPGGSHTLRVWYARDTVISHNVLRDGGEHTLKFHALIGGPQPSGDVVISHNDFGAAGPWSVAIGPQNAWSNEPVEGVLYESNVHRADRDTQVALLVWAREVMVRSNVFIGDGASGYYNAILVDRRGVEPAPRGNVVVNNTCYRGDGVGDFTCVRVADVAEATTVRNTLASAPGIAGASVLRSSDPDLTEDHNVLTASPGFADPDADDFTLTASSMAIDAGYDTGVPYDFAEQLRVDVAATPNTGEGHCTWYDLGAFEYQP